MTDEEITRWLFVEDAPAQGDLALVFACAGNTESERRVARAAELWHQAVVPVLLMTGGGAKTPVEAELVAGWARDRGVPDERLLLEKASSNTFENAELSRRLLEEKGRLEEHDRLLLVTSSWHMLRVHAICKHVFPEHELLRCPSTECCNRDNWTRSEGCRQTVEQEVFLIDAFRGAGLLPELEAPPTHPSRPPPCLGG